MDLSLGNNGFENDFDSQEKEMTIDGRFWNVIYKSLERYSESTVAELSTIMSSKEGVPIAEKMIQNNPTEEVLLDRIEKELSK